jgi:hypothetical protein
LILGAGAIRTGLLPRFKRESRHEFLIQVHEEYKDVEIESKHIEIKRSLVEVLLLMFTGQSIFSFQVLKMKFIS